MIIRNGVLYRDAANTRDLLLIYADGRFKGVRAGEYDEGKGQAYIDAGVVQSFAFGPVLVNEYESVDLPESYVIYTCLKRMGAMEMSHKPPNLTNVFCVRNI